MTNLEIIMSTEAFNTYILDPKDLYIDASSLDKWKLVREELEEKGYIIESSTWDLEYAWIFNTINELPQFKRRKF